jgi:hypothetical protein
VVAYPQGFEFSVLLRLRRGRIRPLLSSGPSPPSDMRPPPNPFLAWRWRGMGEVQGSAVQLALWVEGTSWSVSNGQEPDERLEESAPRLLPLTSSFSAERGESEWWVNPVPPPGLLTILCEWPDQGVPPTHSTVDTQVICDAAQKCEDLWDGDADEG